MLALFLSRTCKIYQPSRRGTFIERSPIDNDDLFLLDWHLSSVEFSMYTTVCMASLHPNLNDHLLLAAWQVFSNFRHLSTIFRKRYSLSFLLAPSPDDSKTFCQTFIHFYLCCSPRSVWDSNVWFQSATFSCSDKIHMFFRTRIVYVFSAHWCCVLGTFGIEERAMMKTADWVIILAHLCWLFASR